MSSSAAAASLLKPLSFSDTFLASPAPPSSKPSLAFPPPKPFNFPSLAKSAASRFGLAPFVARMSDWAQQQEEEGAVGDGGGEEGGGWAGEGGEALEEEMGGAFAEPSEDAKLFVGNLPYDFDSEAVANLFNQAGVVEIAETNRLVIAKGGIGFVAGCNEALILWG
uniref:RRM domain-containing protein n=1 Tax=Kalanchoe fedtschenkoi TaxID=63787 RepID=A0A7N0TTR1_KALFE